MKWRQFVMDLEALDPDRVEAVFLRHGALSVTLSDAADDPVFEPLPGEVPLWRDTRIVGLFDGDGGIESLQADLCETFQLAALPGHRVEALEDRDWEREWLKHFRPMRFGRRLWICPDDLPPGDEEAVVVRLDPGLAFGTGTHATTSMCLEWLDSLQLAGNDVLDYGCGSGVLAIAAVKLGASRAVAMDIDSQAVLATRANAARNGVEDIEVVCSDATLHGRFDIVIANILAGPLVELVHSVTSRLREGGKLALSGVLSDQVPDIIRAYKPRIRFDKPVLRVQDGQAWALLSGSRIETG